MFYEKIRDDKEMIDYLIDCTLATVENFIGKKSTPKEGEFKRQCCRYRKHFKKTSGLA